MTSTPRASKSAKPKAPKGPSAARAKSSKSAGQKATAKRAGGANRVAIRVYRHGLGDCILVRVKRPGQADYKLLIDCGLVLGAKQETGLTAAEIMTRVVDDVVAETKEAVDAVAVTHEHWDHLSGFAQARASFAKLSVGEVWVAWTESEDDDLAKQLRQELSRAKQALAFCGAAAHAVGDSDTLQLLQDVALTPMGAAGAGPSTADIFKGVKEGSIFSNASKHRPKLRMFRPMEDPIEIPGTDARIYVLGPPHDPKLIRKINPSTRSPETYGLALNGDGVLSQGLIAALAGIGAGLTEDDRKRFGIDGGLDAEDDGATDPQSSAPFHKRMTIPLANEQALEDFAELDPHGEIRTFFTENYFQSDPWRRIDAEWLGAAPELAMAIQSYTNNTSLVLALEIGPVGKGDVFLLAADAQVGNWDSWQNWQWPQDKPKVTGPDLLGRTIFYKVGHHGSHNATLKDHGLEQMARLKVAVCPVSEKQAQQKHWDKMPLPELMQALQSKNPKVVVLRTDQTPDSPPENVRIDELYFDISL